jgi:hypothetical protein
MGRRVIVDFGVTVVEQDRKESLGEQGQLVHGVGPGSRDQRENEDRGDITD